DGLKMADGHVDNEGQKVLKENRKEADCQDGLKMADGHVDNEGQKVLKENRKEADCQWKLHASKTDLSYIGLFEFAIKPVVENKSSEEVTKAIRKNHNAPIVED
nr:hypothetical protein [Tanacetum cinerariifolium]